jgi:transcription initiation factor TFIIB
MVISEKTQETRPESRTSPNTTEVSKKRAGTGMPNSLASADMGLSTIIGKSNRDASGNKIEPSVLSTMHRLRTWDFRTQVHTSELRINLVYRIR